jgi:hypothetical protein
MPRDPEGHEIHVEWTVVRVEKHGRKFIDVKYHYLCQDCALGFCSRQTSLPMKSSQPTNTTETPP